jgi:hypothetical protein
VGQADPPRVCRRVHAPDEGAWGARFREEACVTESSAASATESRKARPSTVRSSQPTGERTNDAPRGASVQVRLQTGNGEQPKPRQCAPRGATAVWRGHVPRRAPSTDRCSREHSEVEVTATRRRWRTASGLPERWRAIARLLERAREPQRLKRCVSTPLRRPRPDPGSGSVSGRCTLSPRGVGRSLQCVGLRVEMPRRPPSGW